MLQVGLPDNYAKELAGHHGAMSAAFLTGDWEKALLRGGKVAECLMKIIRFLRTGESGDDVAVDKEIKAAERDSGLISEARTLLPRHARVLYDHRNKRGGGHGSFEPTEMDATVALAVANWVVAELLRLYGGEDGDTAHRIVQRLVRPPMPLVEEIDGDMLVLAKSVSVKDQVGLLLLRSYPERLRREQLKGWVRSGSDSGMAVALNGLHADVLIHENEDGVVLTSTGTAWISRRVTSLREKSLA